MNLIRRHGRVRSRRPGAVLVEGAIALGCFVIIMLGVFEFGRAYMITQILNAAARAAARMGVTEDTTTADLEKAMKDVVKSAGLDPVQDDIRVIIIDASPFDDNPTNPPSMDSLLDPYRNSDPSKRPPNYEIDDAVARQLVIVRVECDFEDVALFTPKWLNDWILRGQCVVRKE